MQAHRSDKQRYLNLKLFTVMKRKEMTDDDDSSGDNPDAALSGS